MILLDSTSDLIDIVTGSAADVEVHASYVDHNAGTITPASDNIASITTATTTTIVASPAASTQRSVRHINIYNNHASTATLVTVRHTDGTDVTVLFEVTLAASETLVFGENGVWAYYDPNGKLYTGLGPFATQAEMGAGASSSVIVSPASQHFHPSAAKAWGMAPGAGTSLTVSYNITSVADTGTGRLGVTIATDFSSASYSIVCTLQRSVTALTATGVEDNNIRNASQTAGVFEIESYDHTAILFAAQDPAQYYWACFGDQ